MLEQHQVAGQLADLDIDQDEATFTGLPNPRPRDGRNRAGGDYPVKWGMLGQASCPVSGHQGGAITEVSQAVPSQLDQFGFDVYGEDMRVAEPMAQQCGVVVGAGSDLQYPVPVADVERLEHAGHQAGHAGGRAPTWEHEHRGIGVHRGRSSAVRAAVQTPVCGSIV